MKNIFRHLKKYWYYVLFIFLLLIVQAFCDLSLPDYTSNLIDVGISNAGIEHAVPEYLTENGFQEIELFLSESEKTDWEKAYFFDTNNAYYKLNSTEKETWEKLDEEFSQVIAIVYMMTSQENAKLENLDFSNFSNIDMSAIDSSTMTPEQIEQFQSMKEIMEDLGVDITSDRLLLDIRNVFAEKISSLGDSIIFSMAKQFASEQYELCGINTEQIQTNYLWSTGAKMLCMALIMAIAAILVGLLASKT
ncbi:MAG: ABC transporter ATP-binding protein, partial [Ruminococcus sp.]|nr:ABC transporter ATP-binding protein [Ruminococcus sp.]